MDVVGTWEGVHTSDGTIRGVLHWDGGSATIVLSSCDAQLRDGTLCRMQSQKAVAQITGDTSLIFWGNATRIDAERLSVAGVLWTLQSAAWPHDIGGISLWWVSPSTSTTTSPCRQSTRVKKQRC